MIGERDRELITYVQSREGISSQGLSRHFGVSDRTVRSRIKSANEALSASARIIWRREAPKPGYCLEVADEEAFRARLALRAAPSTAMPQGRSGRVAYLLDDLLTRDDWVTLGVLANILYVSRASISADLKEVSAFVERHGLSLMRRPRYGIRIEGSEINRRRCLAAVAIREIESHGDAVESAQRLMLDKVSGCVSRVLEAERFPVTALAQRSTSVHIAIALLRHGSAPVSSDLPQDVSCLGDRRPHEVARRIVCEIGKETGVMLPDSEVAYIAVYLAGLRVLSGPSDGDGAPVISQEVWGLVDRMIDAVWQMFRFDLRDDIELRMNLARHVHPLVVRLRYRISLGNPLVGEIRRTYPLAYSMAIEASGVLVATYGEELPDDEVGYIALSFALSLERRATGAPHKNVLVVCASGLSSARLLAYKIKSDYGAYLGRVEICNLSEVPSRDLSDIDYLFTTVPIPYETSVPQLQVGLLFGDDDRHEVGRVLARGWDPQAMRDACDARLFFPHLAFETKREVLHFLCGQVRLAKNVSPDFEDLVFAREELAPTVFGNGVAIPHPAHPASAEALVCVGLLDHPITWDSHQVSAVFLISASRESRGDLQALYRPLAHIWMSGRAIGRLLDKRSHEALLSELEAAGNGGWAGNDG